MKYYIGIDLGGTNIVAGVVDENFSLIATASNKNKCRTSGRSDRGNHGSDCSTGCRKSRNLDGTD